MKYTKSQIQKLLDEKRNLAIKDKRTVSEVTRLRELNYLLKDYDYRYFTPLWLKICKRVGKFLIDISEKL